LSSALRSTAIKKRLNKDRITGIYTLNGNPPIILKRYQLFEEEGGFDRGSERIDINLEPAEMQAGSPGLVPALL
jgi:hypothetical protein